MNSLSFSPPAPTTLDGFKRRVSYLRVSLTDRCNLRCRYCMPLNGIEFFKKEEILSLNELKRLLKIFRSLGVTKIRFTGGEPLLRTDLPEIIREAVLLGVEELSLTTNGLLLCSQLEKLVSAGLKRINISLDTLKQDRFLKITGAQGLDFVLEGIYKSLEFGLNPVKINMVVMREWNLDEIPDFVRLALEFPLEVRFLELMPTANNFEGTAGVSLDSFVPIAEIKNCVEKVVILSKEEGTLGVAKVFPLLNGKGKIGFISPVSNHFCESCNRIRLTARGELKSCLHGSDLIDLRTPLKAGASDQEISSLIQQALLFKPEEHFIRPNHFQSQSLHMSQVGG
ncbi:MAG: GTP 3',8-cyclase MoaA [Elusimicrobia bacterium]|nr:GTP 3',8-cyclase MoaA [Elusimicrobiota bacterium]